ncbi:hypothetical protein P4O66_020069, partial [Electrophorus voltai]
MQQHDWSSIFRSSHVTPLLRSVHWLPVAARIRFKNLILAYKAKNGPAPSYMRSMVKARSVPRVLRTSSISIHPCILQYSSSLGIEVRLQDAEVCVQGVELHVHGVEVCVQDVELRLQGVEVRVQGVEVCVQGVEVRVQGVEVCVQGVEVRVQGVECNSACSYWGPASSPPSCA